MTDKEPKRSTLGKRMNDCYFIVEDASGKSKGVIDSKKKVDEAKPGKDSDTK